MPLSPDHVGQRVVVRRLLPGEQGPSGGPAMTDLLGILESFDDTTLVIRPEDGEPVRIERALVVTGKPVPPRGSTRLRISAEALERVCEQGWRATDTQPLGAWTLRAAAGFTGRANSARIGGDPGLPTVEALSAVEDFYAERGLPPLAQVVVGSAWSKDVEAAGWARALVREQDALVQVASVAQARRRATARAGSPGSAPPAVVHLEHSVDPDWMQVYGRTDGQDAEVVRTVLESGDEVAFARIGDPVVAIGRGVVTGDWLGLQAVEVVPGHRGQGLGSAVVEELLAWGASRGALSAYLQTLSDNTAALALYAKYGFTTHHAYRYLAPPRR